MATCYSPNHFRQAGKQELLSVIRRYPLATIVTADGEGAIHADHIPLQYGLRPYDNAFTGHVAKANPLWKRANGKSVLVIFSGPDHYVCPGWYPSKATLPHGAVVPTWNYAVVHARGTLEAFHDRESLLSAVRSLTEEHEARTAAADRDHVPWTVTTETEPADGVTPALLAKLDGIVGIRIQVQEMEGKWKMSQNKSRSDQQGIVMGLLAAARGSGTGPAATAVRCPRPR